MTKSAQALSVSDFLSLLEKSGLLDDSHISSVRDAATEHSDAKSLARQLVGQSQVTKWQANQLLHGYSQLTVGKYRLLDQLGTGRVGREFLAEHVQLGRRVALKLVSRRLTADPKRLKTFLAEYRRAGSLDHPNLVHSFDVDQEGQHYYVVTEFVDGNDLQSSLRAGRLCDLQTALRYLLQAAHGLKFAFEAGVPHGDLKPSNLLIARDGSLKVSDLGFANLVNSLATEVQTGEIDETAYVAPEIVGGNEASVTAQSDIFSLGQIGCFLLTGTVLSPDSAEFSSRKEQLQKQISDCEDVATLYEQFTATSLAERTNSWQAAIDLLQSISTGAATQSATIAVSSETSEKAGGKRDMAVAEVIAVTEDTSDSTDAFPVNLEDSQTTESLDGFFINTESTSRPKTAAKSSTASAPVPARKSKAAKQPKPASTESDSVQLKKTSGKIDPKVLIGGVAGGLVLLLMLTAGAVWLFIGTGKKIDVVAEGKSTTTDAATRDNDVKAATEKATDTAILPSTIDKPSPFATALDKPAAVPSPKTATVDPVSVVASTDKKPEQPAADPTPATAPTAPGSGLVAAINESKPNPEPAPAAPVAVAAPALPVETAKPKAFEKLPRVVDLLALADPSKAGTPVPIGEIDVTPSQLVSILLHGGDGAFRGKQAFSLQNANAGVDPRNWEFAITGKTPDDSIVIGKLHLAEKQLTFEWTAAAAQQSAASNLVNCLLKLSAGNDTTSLALRAPTSIDPVALDLEKGSIVKFPLENIPDPKKVFVELVGLETASFPNPEFKPESSVEAAKGTMYLWVGDKPEQRDFGLRIDTSDKSKWIEVRFSPCIRSDPQAQPIKLNKKVMAELVGRIDQRLALVTVNAAAVQASELTAEQKKQQQQLAEQELAKLNEQRGRVLAADELKKRLHNTATPHIRISYVADGEKLILAETKGAPPPEEPKKVAGATK